MTVGGVVVLLAVAGLLFLIIAGYNTLASFFRFQPRGSFELDGPQDRQVPRVAFGS